MRRNAANQVVTALLRTTSATPTGITSGATVMVTKDGGTPTSGAGTLTYIGSGTAFSGTAGLWKYVPTAAETNASHVSFMFGSSNTNTVMQNIQFEPTAGPILLQTTIATYSSQTSFTLTAGSTADDTYNGCLLVIYDSTTEAQTAIGVVSDYTGSTKTITLLNSPLSASFTFAAGDFITIIADRSLKPSTDTRTLVVDSNGLADANAVKVGPSGSGIAQTARDIGAAVPAAAAGASGGLLISGSNTGTTTFGALTVTNATTLSGAVQLGSTLVVTGNTTFTGSITATNGSNSISGVTTTLSTAESRSVVSGTSNTNTTTTVVFNDSTNTTANYYQGMLVKFTSGNCNGQSRVVTSSSNTTNVTTLTVSRAFTTTPTASATYTVLSDDAAKVDSSSRVTADLDTIKTQSITCSAGVTVAAFVGNATAALSVDASGRVDVGKTLGSAVTLDANNVLNVSAKYWAGTAITATSIPVATAAGLSGGLFIAGSNAATTVNITGNLTGNVSGSVGSVTGLTTATIATAVWTDTTAGDFTTSTSPGKIIFSQLGGAFTTTSSSVFSTAALANGPSGGSAPTAAQIATAVWTDTTASDFTTANSIGKSIMNGVSLGTGLTVANLTNAPTSGDLTAAMIASVTAACTASTPAATIGSLGADAITGTSLATSAITKIQANMATTANITALNNISTTDVKNQVIAALDTDTYTMPGAETPAETTTLRKMIQFLYKWMIRKKTQTSTFTSLYSADGNTVEQKAPVSDDGTTTTVGKIVTGP